METLGRMLSAFGPLGVGILGLALTVLGASVLKNNKRWWVLYLGPIVTVIATYLLLLFVSKVLNPAEGSGFLIGGFAFGLQLFGIVVYYPILIIVSIIHWFKRRKETHSSQDFSSPRTNQRF